MPDVTIEERWDQFFAWKRNAAGEVVYLNKDGTWLSQCTFGWFDTRVELDILLQKDSTQK